MLYRLAADLVLLLHLGFIVFAIFGAFAASRFRYVIVLHLPAAAWAFSIMLTGEICPLTWIENDLRMKAGLTGYPGGFVEHYLLPLIYPERLTPRLQSLLALGVLAVNVAAYARWWRRRRGNTPGLQTKEN